MIMILHEGVDMNDKPESPMGLSQPIQEIEPVLIGPEKRLPAVPSIRHVVKRAWVFDAAESCHRRSRERRSIMRRSRNFGALILQADIAVRLGDTRPKATRGCRQKRTDQVLANRLAFRFAKPWSALSTRSHPLE